MIYVLIGLFLGFCFIGMVSLASLSAASARNARTAAEDSVQDGTAKNKQA